MRKKPAKKIAAKTPQRGTRLRRKSSVGSVQYTRYIIISFAVILLVLIASFGPKALDRPHVLGASVYLADQENGEINVPGDNMSGANGGPENNSSGSSNNTQVDCVGPDGKHFTTTLQICAKINDYWHNNHFSFTPLQPQTLSKPSMTNDQKKPSGIKPGTTIHFQQAGDTTEIKAQHPDGTEENLQKENSLEKLNQDLQQEDMHIGTTAANGFVLRKGDVSVHTTLPLSVDPTTHTLTITTPDGTTKQVTVLPDQAIKNLLEKKLMDTVENEATPSSSSSSQKIQLTTINNQPVFSVKGMSNKKVFGIFPLSFAKTAFVSAETGDVVQVDQTALSKFIELFSF
jgi:hypothetical protein